MCAFVFRTHDFYPPPPPPPPLHALWSQGSLEQHQEARGFLLLPPAPPLTEAAGFPIAALSQSEEVLFWFRCLLAAAAPPPLIHTDVCLGFHTVLTQVFHLHVNRTLPRGICPCVFSFAQLPARMEEMQVQRSEAQKRDKVASLRMFVTWRAVSQVVRKKKPSLQDAELLKRCFFPFG